MNVAMYQNQMHYPRRTDFTTTFYYRAGRVVAEVKPGEIINVDVSNCVKESIINEDAFRTAQNEYGKMTAELERLFQVALFEENGVEHNEFTQELYRIAYRMGHSSGLGEVETYFLDLVDLDVIARKVYGK